LKLLERHKTDGALTPDLLSTRSKVAPHRRLAHDYAMR